MNNSKDNLEDFFHQSFQDSEVVHHSGDWNLPSDAVWEGIQDGMTEERKLSFVFLKWPWSAIAASYLLVMGGYQFLEKYSAKNDLISAITLEEILVSNENSVADTPCVDDFFSNEKEVQNSQPLSMLPEILTTKKANDKRVKQEVGVLQIIDNQIVNGNSLEAKNQELWAINLIASLTTDKVDSPSAANQKLNINTLTPTLPTASNAYVALNYSPISESLTPQDLNHSLSLNSDQTEMAKGKSIGIDVGLTNEKGWSIETGIHYTQLEKETVVNQLIAETDLTWDETTNLTLEWSDAYGNKEVDFNIRSIASIPPANVTALNMNLTHQTKSHFIDIPILVRKNWTFGKLNISAKTGLLNRFNIANSYEQPLLTTEDKRFEILAAEFRQNSTIENKKYVPQLVAGIGLEYFIQPNLSVYMEPTYSRSLRPVIDFGFANTHAQNKALTMGMRYHL